MLAWLEHELLVVELMCTSAEAASLTGKHGVLRPMFRLKVVHRPMHSLYARLPCRCTYVAGVLVSHHLLLLGGPLLSKFLALQVYSAAVYLFGHICGAHYTLDIDEVERSVVSLSTAGILPIHCSPLTAPMSPLAHSACGSHRIGSPLVCTPVYDMMI